MLRSLEKRERMEKRSVKGAYNETAHFRDGTKGNRGQGKEANSARMEPVDFNDIMRETKWLLPLYSKVNMELILSLAEERLPVLADRLLIKEVLVDLVANMPSEAPGGPTLTLRTRRVAFESPESGECVHFSMSHRRDCSKNESQVSVGQSFRAKVSSMSVGVGLSRVFKIIKQEHNGNIRIDRGSGDSMTVNIFLPLYKRDLVSASI